MTESNPPGPWSRPLFNLSLRAWQRLRAKYPERLSRRLRIRAYVAGGLVSAMERMQERLHGASLDAVAIEAPIFVIGHWRSGTTMLHEMMALDDRLLSPNTYQCFNPQSFLLSTGSSKRARVSVVRPAGDRAVSPESPQEEEFALLCLGCVSPYEAFVFPRAVDGLSSLCDPDEFNEHERIDWEMRLLRFLKGVGLAGGGKRLLLKSPSNSFRVATLRRIFPDASFVHIVREPTAVIVSTFDMWEKMWERYALAQSLDRAKLRDSMIDTYLNLEKTLENHSKGCPAKALVTIRYEDLVAQPHQTIELIYSALKLGDAGRLRDAISRFLRASPPLRANHPVSSSQIGLVRERCAAIFDKYEYNRS